MSFSRRIGLLTAAAVAVAILLASVLAYLAIAGQLRGEIDDSLSRRAEQFAERPRPGPFGGGGRGPFGGRRIPPDRRGDPDFFERVLGDGGDRLPISDDEQAGEPVFRDVEVGGEPVRLLLAPLPTGETVAIGRSVRETNATLADVRLILLLVALGGIGAAALLGRLVAARAVDPLRRLTDTAEHVARTQDLAQRIDAGGDDEIGRLGSSFNRMLEALDASVRSQRQLIADASHELRTPVTSLRTNIEILQDYPELEPERRAELLHTVNAQAEELTVLMNDVIDLARGDEADAGFEPLRLDELVEEAIERAVRHAPHARFDTSLEETTVHGSAPRLAKAVNNLLDNAVKWNGTGRPIEVRLREGELTVRDHGPGFAPGELEHVFDRFFRGARARDKAGSGLGLAIVRQIAEAHGGTAGAANAEGGGALLSLRLPTRPA